MYMYIYIYIYISMCVYNWHSGLLSFAKQRLQGFDARLPQVVTREHPGERLSRSRCFVEDKRPRLCHLSLKPLNFFGLVVFGRLQL